MDKHLVDFDSLAQVISPAKPTYKLADVADRIEKVAFDVVRFRDNADTDMLWQIEESKDGPVIVALYDETTGGKLSSDGNKDWDAVAETKTASLHIFYKGEPVVKLNTEDMGIPSDELALAAKWLPKKLAEDTEIQSAVLKKMAKDSRKDFVSKYPELQKAANI